MKIIDKYIEKYGSLKVFLIMLLCLITINITIAIVIDINQKSFVIDNLRFKYQNVSNEAWFFKDGNDSIVKAYTLDGRRSLDIFSGTLIVEYGDTIIRQDKDLENWLSKIYVNDHLVSEENIIIVSGSNTVVDSEIAKKTNKTDKIFEVQLIRKVVASTDYILDVGLINLIFYPCFLSLLGISQVVFPKGYWHLKYFLVVDGGEPSDFFIFITQMGGLLLIVIGLLVPLFLVSSR